MSPDLILFDRLSEYAKALNGNRYDSMRMLITLWDDFGRDMVIEAMARHPDFQQKLSGSHGDHPPILDSIRDCFTAKRRSP